jgi:hypothetical protein
MAALIAILPVSFAVGSVSERLAGANGDAPSLTIYTSNLALVRMQVERVLPAGVHTVRIDGLPSNIDPSSLIVLGAGVTLLGAHGYRSYQDAATGSGASLDLDLELTQQAETLELAFLTSGLSWTADYALIVAPNDASAKVDAYASISNGSGTGYEGAEVQLLAGVIRSGGAGRFDDAYGAMRAMEESAAPPALQGAAFADYHVYTVSIPLTLRNGERRRIRLLGAGSVKTVKEYVFSHGGAAYHRSSAETLTRPASVYYQVERRRGDEFGDTPLPAGQVRVYQRDDAGRVQLLGMAGIPNTPAGEDLRLGTGQAFDVIGTRTQTDYERVSGNVYQSAWKLELKNSSDEDVTVQVIEQLSGDWEILESTHDAEKLSAATVRFRVAVPAGGSTTLEYRLSVST